MTEQYKHIWTDSEKKPFMQEGIIPTNLESSINDYQQEAGLFIYLHTLKWNDENGECVTINIEEIIEERKSEEARLEQEAYEDDQDNRSYYSWAQAGRR